MKEDKLKDRMAKLKDKFLKNINQFCKENPGQSLTDPIASLIGTIHVILNIADRKNIFSDEISKNTEKFLSNTLYLFDDIQRENINEH